MELAPKRSHKKFQAGPWINFIVILTRYLWHNTVRRPGEQECLAQNRTDVPRGPGVPAQSIKDNGEETYSTKI